MERKGKTSGYCYPGSWEWVNWKEGILCDWLGEDIGGSLISSKLEEGQKERDVIDQVRVIWADFCRCCVVVSGADCYRLGSEFYCNKWSGHCLFV